jgi:hypothetical protein
VARLDRSIKNLVPRRQRSSLRMAKIRLDKLELEMLPPWRDLAYPFGVTAIRVGVIGLRHCRHFATSLRFLHPRGNLAQVL